MWLADNNLFNFLNSLNEEVLYNCHSQVKVKDTKHREGNNPPKEPDEGIETGSKPTVHDFTTRQ